MKTVICTECKEELPVEAGFAHIVLNQHLLKKHGVVKSKGKRVG